jgi:hypothetical protein
MNATITPVAAVIGTLVGLMAGHQVGAAGRRQAESRADKMTSLMTDAAKSMSKYEGILDAHNIDPNSGHLNRPVPGGAANL